MRRHIPSVLVLVLLGIVVGLAPIAVTGQESEDDATGVSYTLLGSGTLVQFYQFSFAPGAKIPYPMPNGRYPDGYPEAMLIAVTNGPFVIYTGSGTPSGGGEPVPSAPVVLKVIEGEISILNDRSDDPTAVEFDSTDIASTGTECPGTGPRTCTLSQGVGVLLETNSVILLQGPTFCIICYIGDDAAGELEVAAASAPGDFSWTLLPGVAENPGTPVAGMSFRLSTKYSLRGMELPPLNPGSCSGRVQ